MIISSFIFARYDTDTITHWHNTQFNDRERIDYYANLKPNSIRTPTIEAHNFIKGLLCLLRPSHVDGGSGRPSVTSHIRRRRELGFSMLMKRSERVIPPAKP
jgi:hypothetical protein